MNKDNEAPKVELRMPKAARAVLISGLLLALLAVASYSSMDEPSTYDIGGEALAVTVSGDYAYIAMGYDGLQVIDVSDPTNPTFVGLYNSTTVEEITIYGNYAYIIGNTGSPDYEDMMGVLDLSNPTNPTLVDYIQANSVTGIAISGVCDDFFGGIIDPNRSCFAYTTKWSGDMWLIDLSGFHNGHTLSALSGGDYVGTFDNTPYERGGDGKGGQARAVAVSGDYAYIVTSFSYSYIDGEYVVHPGGLLVVDWNYFNSETSLVDDYDPRLKGAYFYGISDSNYNAALSNVYDIAVSGDHAYLAHDKDGLVIVDIRNPNNPTYAGRYNTPSPASSVAVSDGTFPFQKRYVLAATEDDGLIVVDAGNPSSPTYVGGYNTAGTPTDVAESGGTLPFQKRYAYVTTDSGELVVYELPSSRWGTPFIILLLTGIVVGVIIAAHYRARHRAAQPDASMGMTGAETQAQTAVHRDYVDDRDTIVKDSVISKSNVGAGGDDKFARLEKLTEMKKEGLIDDNEFKQMKKEILGK